MQLSASVRWLALLLLSGGCSSEGITPLFEEGFEGCEAPCGKAAGEGEVTLYETLHPAEHAALFDGPVELTIDADFVLDAECELGLFITTTCDFPRSGFDLVVADGAVDLTLPTGSRPVSGTPRSFRDFELDIELEQTMRVDRVTLRNRRALCGADQLQVYQRGDC